MSTAPLSDEYPQYKVWKVDDVEYRVPYTHEFRYIFLVTVWQSHVFLAARTRRELEFNEVAPSSPVGDGEQEGGEGDGGDIARSGASKKIVPGKKKAASRGTRKPVRLSSRHLATLTALSTEAEHEYKCVAPCPTCFLGTLLRIRLCCNTPQGRAEDELCQAEFRPWDVCAPERPVHEERHGLLWLRLEDGGAASHAVRPSQGFPVSATVPATCLESPPQ